MDTITHKRFELSALISKCREVFELNDSQVLTGYLTEEQRNQDCFIVLNETQTTEVGVSRRDYDAEAEIETIVSAYLTEVSIDCYGNESVAMCNKIKNVFQSSYFLSFFKSMGWGVVSMSAVRNLTTHIAYAYEERGQLSVTFSHTFAVSTDLPKILHSTQFFNRG